MELLDRNLQDIERRRRAQDKVRISDNEEISINTEAIYINDLFDGADDQKEIAQRINKLEDTLDNLFLYYKLTGPIEEGCAHFQRKVWISRGDPGWKEAVKAWNESHEPQIKP